MAGFASSLASVALLLAAGCQREAATPPISVAPVSAASSEADRLLVVVNSASPESREIAEYYKERRGVPAGNLVTITVPAQDEIENQAYIDSIERPVRAAIAACKTRVDYIVLTKGVPLRIRDAGGRSVDSHLSSMNLDFPPIEKLDDASILRSKNPYFAATQRFDSSKFKIYLVTRLDGYTVDHVKRMIDRSTVAISRQGLFFFDQAENRNDASYKPVQDGLARAAETLKARGFQAEVDTTKDFRAPASELMGYASWGSNDSHFSPEAYKSLKFLPGALAETFVSTSGRTFTRSTGGQSLVADLIEAGVTGVKGYVSEPYAFALARPEVLFDRYTRGFNLAESFYAASLVVKWKDVVIGDPLCRPYTESIPSASATPAK